MSSREIPEVRDYLKGILEQRRARNPRYSMRSFARDVGFSSSSISEILTGKSNLSEARALRLARGLGLDDRETDYFCLIARYHTAPVEDKEFLLARIEEKRDVLQHRIDNETFAMISDWRYFAIIEWLDILRGQDVSTSDLAGKIGADRHFVDSAIEKLIKFGVIDNDLLVQKSFTEIVSKYPSPAIRKIHDNLLQLARESVHSQDMKQRELSSSVISIAKCDLPRIKQFLGKFREEFYREFTCQPDRDDVYCLSFQLFSLNRSSEAVEQLSFSRPDIQERRK